MKKNDIVYVSVQSTSQLQKIFTQSDIIWVIIWLIAIYLRQSVNTYLYHYVDSEKKNPLFPLRELNGSYL